MHWCPICQDVEHTSELLAMHMLRRHADIFRRHGNVQCPCGKEYKWPYAVRNLAYHLEHTDDLRLHLAQGELVRMNEKDEQ